MAVLGARWCFGGILRDLWEWEGEARSMLLESWGQVTSAGVDGGIYNGARMLVW